MLNFDRIILELWSELERKNLFSVNCSALTVSVWLSVLTFGLAFLGHDSLTTTRS